LPFRHSALSRLDRIIENRLAYFGFHRHGQNRSIPDSPETLALSLSDQPLRLRLGDTKPTRYRLLRKRSA